ncbi:gelsolin-like isoform X2 [Aricia agestis]|uniref:gelsolin-like isoform X2 n=1 Tax=Aricia agestis TaxID=91739 RepID=UPI001C2024CF|nr:gelsolin-like isoform X2 [Aricia agestis]
MPVHPAFANSGKKAGLEVWRIEDFEPVPVPKNQYGNFYCGDSYIVLKTTGSQSLSWDIHFWLGDRTSQDEAGAAAILAVNLDDEQFHGLAVQHRETQGHESKQFLSLFETLRYLDGGHASGFNHVTINAGADKRLFQIKGKRHVRVKQVEASINSMNKGDCFVLDVGDSILLYVGENSQGAERLRAIAVANSIRDQDHNGRAQVDIIDPYSSESDVSLFFTALGSGDRDSVPDAEAGGDDEDFERGATKEVHLNEISDSTGHMQVKKLTPPYTQEQLDSKECYILDTGSSLYVWIGKHSNQREKAEAIQKAQQYREANNYPSWVHISKVVEGAEPAAFKQYFENWN